ncbi:hypothetical protein G9A89_020293 [Geosiphon pyriformis]|nr:hypothetical protein G9A89_020293 [Geosiphon pyriformis]
MSCHVMMLLADLLSKISLMAWPSTFVSVYMVVINLVSRVAPLNNRTGVISSSLNGKIAVSNLLLMTVAKGMLFVGDCFRVVSRLLGEASSGVTRRLK